ncbi:MAG: formylmethanofuran dehydrogenase subunit E family protein [Patescibacteria group bacterium]
MLTLKEKKKIKEFHGHIGPWVVTGFTLGKLAKKYIKGLKTINILNPLFPPKSCLIDGLQLSSGLTIGRGEVRLKKSPQLVITFIGQIDEIKIVLKSEMVRIIQGFEHNNLKKLSYYIGNTYIKFFE